MSYRLAVEHEVSLDLTQRCRDGDELGGPVATAPRSKPNVVAFLARNDPEAVVLELMQPAVAARDALSKERLTRRDEARRTRRRHAGRGERINIGRICAGRAGSGVPATIGPSCFRPVLSGPTRLSTAPRRGYSGSFGGGVAGVVQDVLCGGFP